MNNGRRAARAAPALFMTCLLMSGCATTPTEQPLERLVWPPPPEVTRIEFVRTISSDQDLGTDTTFSQKIIDLLSGQPTPPRHVVQPMGLAVSDDGQRVYVSNVGTGMVFMFDFTQETFVEISGLGTPSGLALDTEERLYVVEQGRRQIAVFDSEGQRVRAITHADIERPVGIAIDRQRGRIYLVDSGRAESSSKTKKGHSIKVFGMDGTLIKTIGGRDAPPDHRMLYPTYAAVDQAGNLYVSDTLNARVQQFDADGNYVRTFGKRGNGFGMFERPKGVAVDSFGNLYVVDTAWSNVQIFNARGEVLLFFGERGSYPGLLTNPTDIAIDTRNRIYVADHLSHRINVYQLVNTRAEDSFLEAGGQEAGGQTEYAGVTGLRAGDDRKRQGINPEP
jgi:DNA-binding beta-propeller fold protein YncE